MGAAALPVAVGMQVMGSIHGAQSAQQEGRAQEGYYRYLAEQSRTEATLAEMAGAKQAHSVQDSAAYEFSRHSRGVKQLEGSQAAAAAANGVASSVTAEDIARDTVSRARLDEMAIRFNADSQADEVLRQAGLAAFNARGQARSYDMAGTQARRAGDRQAFATLLGGASSIASTFAMANAGPTKTPGAPAGGPAKLSTPTTGSGSMSPFSKPGGLNLQIARPYR